MLGRGEEISAMLTNVIVDEERQIQAMGQAYRMASRKEWKGFKKFYENSIKQKHDIKVLFTPLTVNGDNAFHNAASSKDEQLLKDLLAMLPDSDKHKAFTSKDVHVNTPLHEVATTNCVEAAKLILSGTHNQQDEILKMRNVLGETALYRAAALGKTRMVRHLANAIEKVGSFLYRDDPLEPLRPLRDHFYRKDGDRRSILHIAVLGQHFDTAAWLVKKDEELANEREKNEMTSFQLLALMPTAFLSTSIMTIFKRMAYHCLPIFSDDDEDDDNENNDHEAQDLETGKNHSAKCFQRKKHKACPKIEEIWKEKKKHKSGVELVSLLAKKDLTWKQCDKTRVARNDATVELGLGKKGTNEKKECGKRSCCWKNSSKPKAEIPLIFAASTGIVEIFEEITKHYPQAIEYVTAEGQNVLHVAIIYRKEKIYERIKTMKKTVVKLAARIDNYGDTILHHAADMTFYPGGTRPGPALQFQEELEWYQRAREQMPSHYFLHRNKENITAQDLFQETHAKQHEEAQKWMKDTAGSCSTLAILVAGVVFAAAYTVPGGVKEENGLPVLLNSPFFMVFTIMAVMSLAFSLTSVVMFLSVLTSPYKQEDFLSLPRKLTTGFLFLFLSVLTTMATFAASVLLTVRLEKHWTTTLFSTASLFPATTFALIMFPSYAPFLGNSIKSVITLLSGFSSRGSREIEI